MYQIPTLPLAQDVETKAVLKQLAQAHRRLAELKGAVKSMPNENILINTLSLQEAKDSSAVESIITTHDELYKAELFASQYTTPASKEVQSYADALRQGFTLVKEKNLLTCNTIIEIYRLIKRNTGGFRATPGTTLQRENTHEIIYTPPQSYDEIVLYMRNLELFINDASLSEVDPLVKMAIIHHQFESIHPFSDGNGRTGRIINILYLVLQGLLDLPVLYLSRYVIQNKSEYYRLLQQVRDRGEWEEWILFLLKGIEITSQETVRLVEGIKCLMQEYKQSIRNKLPKIYSQDLLNNLFRHPYTKIEFVCNELNVTRPTATSYLNQLEQQGYVQKLKLGRENFYLNNKLFDLLLNAFHLDVTEQVTEINSIG
ncbi:Fic family protein [uncultured Rikenella sp.]|uniref:Fic family protein n=1 Tax=uncultured Rikenella sp. TaxID=368003 RepID=UPI00261DB07D|nr:Fic family protein [uncultured Rikenella sp.]